MNPEKDQIEAEAETEEADEVDTAAAAEDEDGEYTANDDTAPEDDEPGEYVVTLAGEEDQDGEGEDDAEGRDREDDSSVLRTLRKRDRESAKKIRELERKLAEATPAEPKPELGPKPELADFDYDEAKYDEAHAEWLDKKREFVKAEEDARQREEAARAAFDEKVERYQARKTEFKAVDYDDAEDTVRAALSPQFMGIMLDAVPDAPERMVYALGKRPDLLEKFAKIENPVVYVRELVKLEGELKVKPARPKTKPEERVRGGTAPPTSGEKAINRAREKAGSGNAKDLTEVIKARKAAQAR